MHNKQSGKIIVVDDDNTVRFFVVARLRKEGWLVDEAESGESALSALARVRYDVMLLDLRMTGIDGIEVMRQSRERWPDLLIIIMTAYATLESAIEAVHHGAFEYLEKPCDTDDLVACVQRALNEKEKTSHMAVQPAINQQDPVPDSLAPPDSINTGHLHIEPGAHRVHLDDSPLSLTPTEYGILYVLAQSLGQPVSSNELITEGLKFDFYDHQARETLRVHISNLRRKIGARYILTVRGGGYMLAHMLD